MSICYSSSRNEYAVTPTVRSAPEFSRVEAPCRVFTRKGWRLASSLRGARRESEDTESRWATHAGVQDSPGALHPETQGFLQSLGQAENTTCFICHSSRLVTLRVRTPGPAPTPRPSAPHSLSLLWVCPYTLPGSGPRLPPSHPHLLRPNSRGPAFSKTQMSVFSSHISPCHVWMCTHVCCTGTTSTSANIPGRVSLSWGDRGEHRRAANKLEAFSEPLIPVATGEHALRMDGHHGRS